jgi:hypothetical protein
LRILPDPNNSIACSWFLNILLSSSHCATLSSCHHAGWLLHPLLLRHPLVLLLHRPLVVSSRQLVLAYPLVILSLHRPLILSSRWLVVALPLVAPPSPAYIAPPSHPLFAPADCCIASCCPLDVLPSCPLIAPAGCCVASPCSAL